VFDGDKRDALDEQHSSNPEAGDYWEEMLCGACVVLAVSVGMVIFCKTRKELDSNHWQWGLDKKEVLTLDAFKDWLHYKTMPDKCWCHVHPRAHIGLVNDLTLGVVVGEKVTC